VHLPLITPVPAAPQRDASHRRTHGRPRRRRRALIAALVTLAVVVVGGGLVTTHLTGTLDLTGGSPTPESLQAAPPRLSMPEGKPFIIDALTTGGQWFGTEVVGEPGSNCDVTDGALRVARASPGFFTCAGPEKQISGDHTIAVTARIEKPGSCIGIWLYWSEQRSYQLTACEDAFRVAVDRNGEISYVVREVPLGDATLRVGTSMRLQVVVRDGVVRFGHDGIQVGEAPLPEADIDRGRPMIGLVSPPEPGTPPYAASFNDIDVRTLAG
jgi:hypothetical protein